MFVLLVLFLGLGWSASISPIEIAEARQRCTTQCNNPNHVEAAACMRQCWATFFAERKAGRTFPHVPARSVSHPSVKARSAPAKARSISHPSVRSRSTGAAATHKMVHHPIVKGRSKAVGKKKPVAPFAHTHARSGAVQQALVSLGALIALILVIQ